MNAKKQLNDFRANIKEHICNALVDLYKQNNNGELPNWEDEEDLVVMDYEVSKHKISIRVEVDNTYDDTICIEKVTIDRYIVTLDYNLFFDIGNEEMEWTDVSTDELVGILDIINNKIGK